MINSYPKVDQFQSLELHQIRVSRERKKSRACNQVSLVDVGSETIDLLHPLYVPHSELSYLTFADSILSCTGLAQ
jgi:hypothetical protein